MTRRPFAWEQSYPPSLQWDMPLEITTLPDMLAGAVARYGDHPFIEFRGERISYRQFGARVDALAAGLQRLGVQPGVAVALFLPNSPYHPVSFFAVLKAGGRVVHLSPLDPLRSLQRKLADSGARMLVAPDFPSMLPQAEALLRQGLLDHLIIGQDAEWGPGVPTAPLPDAPGVSTVAQLSQANPHGDWPGLDPADIAVLQYTGGTTGLPRAAMLTHANLTAAVNSYGAFYDHFGKPFTPSDRVIGVLPLFHIYMLTSVMLRCIRGGAELMLRLRFDPAQTLDDIEHGRATHFPGVPTMFIAMAAQPDLDRRDFSSLKTASSGGAPLPVEVAHRFEAVTGHRVGGGWGMTETSPAGTVIPPGVEMRPGLIGLPLPRIEMDVVDLADPHRVLPIGEVGEIRIRGPNVTAGYWNRPEENATTHVDGYFLTGDIGRMDEQGHFYIVDRKKDMIISGGFNVYPRVIEDAIYEHSAVEECSVIGIADPYRGQSAKAFIKLGTKAEPFTIEDLRAFLADKLARHELPVALEFREQLPRTPVGKLSRKALADEELSRIPEKAAL